MNMNVLLVAFLLIGLILVSGCAAPQQPAIKTQEEAKQTVSNVSKNIDDVSQTLKEIDDKLK